MTWAWLRHPIMAVLAIVVFVLCFGNFFWFASEYSRLGGGASSGMVQDGRYFGGNRGDYHEVTREDWEWSRAHEASLVISHPLTMLAMAYLLFGWIFPLGIGPVRPDTAARVAQVRATGPPLASEYVGVRRCTAGQVEYARAAFTRERLPGRRRLPADAHAEPRHPGERAGGP